MKGPDGRPPLHERKGLRQAGQAKQATSDLAFGKEVTVQTHGLDKYRRTIADVLLPDGTNVNHPRVKEGWYSWYRKYAPGDTALEGLEHEAREAKKGLWADPHPKRKRFGWASHGLLSYN
ncbi:MAG: thermonuclease family protein [Nitrospiraceae bacterium]